MSPITGPQPGLPSSPSLQQLRDIQLPEPIGWWPPAPGWWLLLVLLASLLAWGVYRIWRQWQRRRYRRQALAELTRLRNQPTPTPDARLQQLQQLNQLLRRTALSGYPSDQVAGLHGDNWLAFLADSGQLPGFTQAPGRLLVEAAYQRDGAPADPAPLFNLAAQWIRNHRNDYHGAEESDSC